jgi:hypothetical protein
VPRSSGSSAQTRCTRRRRLAVRCASYSGSSRRSQAVARMSWLPGRRCRNQLGFAASWAKFGVKITRSTSLAIPAPSRAKEPTNNRFDVVARPCATSDVRG